MCVRPLFVGEVTPVPSGKSCLDTLVLYSMLSAKQFAMGGNYAEIGFIGWGSNEFQGFIMDVGRNALVLCLLGDMSVVTRIVSLDKLGEANQQTKQMPSFIKD